ncbi:MAG: type II toxin-antitoxin system RatA family toxin [Nitrosopumilaceae archaeon]
MAEITASVQVNAPLEKVWSVVSDLDNEPMFWKAMTGIRNISQEGSVVRREVTLGKVNRCMQIVTLSPKEKVHTEWIKGTIKGTKDLILSPNGNTTKLEAVLDYKFTGMAGFLSGKLQKDVQFEAEQAIQLIKEKAEGQPEKTVKMEERPLWADLINEKDK